jgi:hypothetical protein
MPSLDAPRSVRLNVWTLASIGVIACVAADMVHEALGHGTVSWLTHDTILSISTVALQNAFPSRAVSAAGTAANFVIGAFALLSVRHFRRFTAWAYLLLLFGAYNLMNCGYLVVSAALNSGDWANVIAGMAPAWLWRSGLALMGVVLYILTIRWVRSLFAGLIERGEIAQGDLRRLVVPAYLAGGIVMTLASVLNPISPWLIPLSGAGASFGLNWGLLLLPGMLPGEGGRREEVATTIAFSWPWIAAALAVAGIFVGILGPGLRFAK